MAKISVRGRSGEDHSGRRGRDGEFILRPGLPRCGVEGDRRALRCRTAIRATSPRCIRSPPATCAASRASITSPSRACSQRAICGSYPSGPSSSEPPHDLADDRAQRDRRLQRALRHPVRHASRGGGEAAGRADQGRARHFRRSAPPGLRHERGGGGEPIVKVVAVRRRGVAVFPGDRSRGRDHPRHHRRRARQPHLSSTRAPISAALDQALAARNNGGIVIAQVKRVAESRHARSRMTCACRACWSTMSSRRRTRGRRRRRPTIRRSPARSSGRCRASALPEWGIRQGRSPAAWRRSCRRAGPSISASASRPTCRASSSRKACTARSTWVIEQGAVGGVPLLDFQFGCASNAEAIVPSPHQFTYFQGGGFDCVAAVLPADRPPRLGQCLEASASGRM